MNPPSAFTDFKDELERHEFQMGAEAGRLAVTLDILTDALILVGQHGVYCQSARQPGKPAMDVQIISQNILQAKELVSSVIELLRARKREERG
jgi:apolipoprotein N-acyltransferase